MAVAFAPVGKGLGLGSLSHTVSSSNILVSLISKTLDVLQVCALGWARVPLGMGEECFNSQL